jgi:endonuclease G, mitochondrial
LTILLLAFAAISQSLTYTYRSATFTSLYSYRFKSPLHVSYKLYRGGGDCSRSGYGFVNGNSTATRRDFQNSGYDMGHLCNAEDFAYDCRRMKQTFIFYNAIPQTPELNRGIWKKYETEIRLRSQQDSLLIIAGGIYRQPYKSIGHGVYIPKYCWKVVQSLTTKKVLYCQLYTNTSKPVMKNVKTYELERMLGYKLPLKK